MFCANCGKEIGEGHQFCQNCGAPLSAAGPRQTSASFGADSSSAAATPQRSLSSGFKTWLWIVMAVSGVKIIMDIADMGSGIASIGLFGNIIINILMIYGCWSVMFRFKKSGIRMIKVISVIGLVMVGISVVAFMMLGSLAADGSLIAILYWICVFVVTEKLAKAQGGGIFE